MQAYAMRGKVRYAVSQYLGWSMNFMMFSGVTLLVFINISSLQLNNQFFSILKH